VTNENLQCALPEQRCEAIVQGCSGWDAGEPPPRWCCWRYSRRV